MSNVYREEKSVNEKQIIMTYKEYADFKDKAIEICEDWKPMRIWSSKDIDYVWFTEKQLKDFIKYIVEKTQNK